jgi:2,4-dienoyl-CoA reductase-like NADH-dependent reductase (Old Yellow Enzyme family)
MTIPLFEPIKLRGVTAPNRLALSPMCQYSAVDGMFGDWHFANLARFAVGGFGIVIVEAATVAPQGRVTYGDVGIWKDQHIESLRRLATFVKEQGGVPAIQLAHAGRKASTHRPWEGNLPLTSDGAEKSWEVVGPSAVAVAEGWQIPTALDYSAMERLRDDWVSAAHRAHAAGFEMIEVHAAHGYLLNSFLSPLSNLRNDEFGGDIAGRMRYPLEVIAAVRAAWPDEKPLSVRISAVDGLVGGWTIEDSVVFARELKRIGVDLVDCSSGGIGGSATAVRLPRSFGFQVPFAEQVRKEAEIGTIAVGLIIDPHMANDIIAGGKADIVAIGREALVEPNWPHLAARDLSGQPGYDRWPKQVGWWLEKRDASLASSSS